MTPTARRRTEFSRRGPGHASPALPEGAARGVKATDRRTAPGADSRRGRRLRPQRRPTSSPQSDSRGPSSTAGPQAPPPLVDAGDQPPADRDLDAALATTDRVIRHHADDAPLVTADCGAVRRVLVVLPTYREADNLEDVLRRLRAAVPSADVLVVDDSSPDGTAEVAKAMGEELGRVDVLVRPEKSGLGTAYRAGFREGLARGYEVLVEMDSDLSHDPAALPPLIAALDQGAALVIGSRYVPGGRIPNWSLYRRSLSRYGNRYAARLLRLDVADATSGFRAYDAAVLEQIDLEDVRAEGYGFQIEMAYRMSHLGPVLELPIHFVDRTRGTSKMSFPIVLEAFLLVSRWGVSERAGTIARGRRRRRAFRQEHRQEGDRRGQDRIQAVPRGAR